VSDICIVGNGIIGLQTAYALLKRDPAVSIVLIGPRSRPGCASLAAAAMFNSFCEIDASTFGSPVETQKFEFNRLSNDKWPTLLKQIESDSGRSINAGFGTYLINNNGSDALEDENFDEIVAALGRYCEPFEIVSPRDIPFYRPEPRYRAVRAILIPREGWVNPIHLINALAAFLENSPRVRFVDDVCLRLTRRSNRVVAASTAISGEIAADRFLICNGASFSSLIEASNLEIHFQRIFYGVGASVLLETGDETLSNCVRTPNRGLACGLYAAPQTPSLTLVGASNFISPDPVAHVRLTSIYSIFKSAMEQLNQNFHRRELVRINIGWRPTSSDTLPLLGKTSLANLFVATGTKRDGLHCSPVIAEFLCDEMLEGRSVRDFDLFNPERKPLKYLGRDEAIAILVRHSINAAYQHDFVPAKSRMTEELERHYVREFTQLHDDVGALTWGIPAELKDMYKHGHIK
jgi:glycine/D-amino acid oxidase-like deaminating enzyme